MPQFIKDPAVRGWLYNIVIAIAALLVGYGFLTLEQSGLWVVLFGAILGTSNGLARAHLTKVPADRGSDPS